jgi:hypothetical protein
MVDVIVEIRENATGLVREHDDSLADGDPYIWSDGNYCCDCNRGLFFARAGGQQDANVQCSADLYSVRVRSKETGSVFYKEFD